MKVAYSKVILAIVIGWLSCCVNVMAQDDTGWLDVSSDAVSSGASMYIDGDFVSTIPAKIRVNSGRHTISFSKQNFETFEKVCDIKTDNTLCLIVSLKASGKLVKVSTAEYAEIWLDGKYLCKGSWQGFLKFGNHSFESKIPGYTSTIDVDFSLDSPENYTIPTPQPEVGSITVTSSVNGAIVKVDGKEYGRTPLTIKDKLTIGKHYIEVRLLDDTISEEIEVLKDSTVEKHYDFPNSRQVRFTSKPSSAQLTIDGLVVGNTPYSAYLSEGEYNISLHAKNHRPVTKSINVSAGQNDFNLKLKRQYIKPSSFYLSGEYQFMGLTGIKGSIGGFIKNVNIEANVVYSLNTTETIYWYIPNTMDAPYGYTYKPIYYGARLGYGFIIGNRLRITPQIGGGVVSITGHVVDEGIENPNATNGYCGVGVAGLRVDFAVAPSVAITLTPSYSLPIMQSGLYSQLIETSTTIKSYVSGFAASAGICFFF